MNWKDAAGALKKMAPAAAKVLPGPLGGIASVVVASTLGVQATPAAIAEAVKTDPDAALKLAAIEADMERLNLLDVQHARRAFRGHWMPPTLTLIYVLMFIGSFVSLILFGDRIPDGVRDAVFMMNGAIIARFTQGGDYWLGSSRGSGEKQGIIDRLNQRD